MILPYDANPAGWNFRKGQLGGAVLVRTGKYCHGDEERFDPPPTVTVESLSAAAMPGLVDQGRRHGDPWKFLWWNVSRAAPP